MLGSLSCSIWLHFHSHWVRSGEFYFNVLDLIFIQCKKVIKNALTVYRFTVPLLITVVHVYCPFPSGHVRCFAYWGTSLSMVRMGRTWRSLDPGHLGARVHLSHLQTKPQKKDSLK